MNKDILSHVGETALLDLIEKQLKVASMDSPPLSPLKANLGFGDDSASIQIDNSQHILVSTDLLMEDIHFRRRYFSPFQLGYKALAVNISDIAAMGGIPTQALIGIALPSNTSISFVKALYNGFIKTCKEYGIQIIGGDTIRSSGPLILAITILGAAEKDHIVTRKGAKPGNRIMVTGALGAAMLGLEILEGQFPEEKRDETAHKICDHFIHPIPRVREAGILAKENLATSMIDLSDSLSQCLTHLCRYSEVGARLEKKALPIAPDVKAWITGIGRDPFLYALTGGEDYELLFTIRAEDVEYTQDLILRETGTSVHEIGEIDSLETGIMLTVETGREEPLSPSGFDHFFY